MVNASQNDGRRDSRAVVCKEGRGEDRERPYRVESWLMGGRRACVLSALSVACRATHDGTTCSVAPRGRICSRRCSKQLTSCADA